MIVTHREREREAESQAEEEAGSMHREPDVGFDPGSPGSCVGPKTGAKPLHHPGIPIDRSSTVSEHCLITTVLFDVSRLSGTALLGIISCKPYKSGLR